MENTTTELCLESSLEIINNHMKNITIMEKTTIQKITAKITTTALLFFLALFTLTTCLVAQESGQARKTGWFVGVSPFSFVGTEIKTSRTTTTAVDTAFGSAASFEYQAAIDSSDGVSEFLNAIRNPNRIITDAEAKQSLIRGAIELCRQGAATTDRILDANIPLDPDATKNTDPNINTVDFYIGYFGGHRTGASKTTEICHLPASDTLPNAMDDSTTESSASESAISLQGALAIQFGYNLGKYRVSLTSFSNKAGANRLTNNVLLADWFLTPGFYAGLGITSAKLETEIGSASQTAPAFNLGYARKIGNLQLEAGYLVLNSSFSIQKQTPTVEVDTQSLPLGEAQTQTLGEPDNLRNIIGGFRFVDGSTGAVYYSRVSVTRTPVSAATVITTTTTTTTEKVELPSQQVIYLRFVWKFR